MQRNCHSYRLEVSCHRSPPSSANDFARPKLKENRKCIHPVSLLLDSSRELMKADCCADCKHWAEWSARGCHNGTILSHQRPRWSHRTCARQEEHHEPLRSGNCFACGLLVTLLCFWSTDRIPLHKQHCPQQAGPLCCQEYRPVQPGS